MNKIGFKSLRNQKHDIKTYLSELRVGQYKMTIAHSVENCVPFLNYQLGEHSFNMSEQFLVNKNFNSRTGKAFIKEIIARVGLKHEKPYPSI
jgi:asparagine synthase (glutamine-hydrolysing)